MNTYLPNFIKRKTHLDYTGIFEVGGLENIPRSLKLETRSWLKWSQGKSIINKSLVGVLPLKLGVYGDTKL